MLRSNRQQKGKTFFQVRHSAAYTCRWFDPDMERSKKERPGQPLLSSLVSLTHLVMFLLDLRDHVHESQLHVQRFKLIIDMKIFGYLDGDGQKLQAEDEHTGTTKSLITLPACLKKNVPRKPAIKHSNALQLSQEQEATITSLIT